MKMQDYMRYSHVGIMFITTFAICFVGGHYADGLCKTEPLFTFLGFMIGFAGGMWVLVKEVK